MEDTANELLRNNIVQSIVNEWEPEEDETDRKIQVKHERVQRLKPYQFQPGQSGNPSGRPKGKSLKEYAKEYFAKLTEEEKLAFLTGIDKIELWRMAEGSPDTKQQLEVRTPTPILGGMTQKELEQASMEASAAIPKPDDIPIIGTGTDTGEGGISMDPEAESNTPSPAPQNERG